MSEQQNVIKRLEKALQLKKDLKFNLILLVEELSKSNSETSIQMFKKEVEILKTKNEILLLEDEISSKEHFLNEYKSRINA